MKKIGLIFVFVTALLFSGCSNTATVDLTEEVIATFPVYDETKTVAPSSTPVNKDLTEEFETIGFALVSGQYTRIVTEDEAELTEMFALEKSNFIRIAHNDIEQEVFAYNYATDDFTYLYYFDGELMTKTKFNIETGAILEDEAEYADLLMSDAEALKVYFYALLDEAGLEVSDLLPS